MKIITVYENAVSDFCIAQGIRLKNMMCVIKSYAYINFPD